MHGVGKGAGDWMQTIIFQKHKIGDLSQMVQDVADKWIASGDELSMSAGWSCYCWLVGNRQDNEFSESKISNMFDIVKKSIHDSPERTKYSMNNFIYTMLYFLVSRFYISCAEENRRMSNSWGVLLFHC